MRLILPERYVEDKGCILQGERHDQAAEETTYILNIKQKYCGLHCDNASYRPGKWGRT